jgi:biopolymer transport protein ExbD
MLVLLIIAIFFLFVLNWMMASLQWNLPKSTLEVVPHETTNPFLLPPPDESSFREVLQFV